jgi:ATP-dependent RNA helicase DDX5/DBP2
VNSLLVKGFVAPSVQILTLTVCIADRYDEVDGRPRRSARGRSRSHSGSDSDRYSHSPKRSRRNDVKARRSRTKSRSRSRSKSRSRSRSRSYTRHRHASHSRSRSPVASCRHEKTDVVSGSARHDLVHQEHKSSPRAHPANDHVDHSDHKDAHHLEGGKMERVDAHPANDHVDHSDHKDARHLEDGKIERVDLDRSPSPPDDKSAPYSPVNGKTSRSISPNGQPESDAKAVEAFEKPVAASPVPYRKNRGDEEEGVIDEDGEIAEDGPRANAAVQNGDGN